MSDDVTIPRETARKAGEDIRLAILTTDDTDLADRLDHLADLLDPPPPTLRDEMVYTLFLLKGNVEGQADAALAVVRKRVAVDPIPGSIQGREVMYRDDVLALLGGDDE